MALGTLETHLVPENQGQIGVPLQNGSSPLKTAAVLEIQTLGKDDDRISPIPIHQMFDEILQARPLVSNLPTSAEHNRLIADSALEDALAA